MSPRWGLVRCVGCAATQMSPRWGCDVCSETSHKMQGTPNAKNFTHCAMSQDNFLEYHLILGYHKGNGHPIAGLPVNKYHR